MGRKISPDGIDLARCSFHPLQQLCLSLFFLVVPEEEKSIKSTPKSFLSEIVVPGSAITTIKTNQTIN